MKTHNKIKIFFNYMRSLRQKKRSNRLHKTMRGGMWPFDNGSGPRTSSKPGALQYMFTPKTTRIEELEYYVNEIINLLNNKGLLTDGSYQANNLLEHIQNVQHTNTTNMRINKGNRFNDSTRLENHEKLATENANSRQKLSMNQENSNIQDITNYKIPDLQTLAKTLTLTDIDSMLDIYFYTEDKIARANFKEIIKKANPGVDLENIINQRRRILPKNN